MGKSRNPIRFSGHYGIDADEREGLGIIDPTLNADTKLFIDPLLLEHPSHTEVSKRRAADVLRVGFTPFYLSHQDGWRAVDILAGILDRETWRDPRYAERQAVT